MQDTHGKLRQSQFSQFARQLLAAEDKRSRANDLIALFQQEYADVFFLVLETLFNPLRLAVQCMTRKLTMTFFPALYNSVQVSIKPNFQNLIILRSLKERWAN